MKITENNNYGQYLKAGLAYFFSQSANYIYLGLITLAVGLYWNKEGFNAALRGFIVLTNAFIVTFLLTEIIQLLTYKEFRRNRFITFLLTIAILTTINIYCFDNTSLYWSFVGGLIFMVPVIIVLIAIKIRL